MPDRAHWRRGQIALIVALALVAAGCRSGDADRASPTEAAVATRTVTATATPAPTHTSPPATPSPTVGVPTATIAPTLAPSATRATETPTPQDTVTATSIPSPTLTATTGATVTSTVLPAQTPTSSPPALATLTLLRSGFGQVPGSTQLGFGFVVRNDDDRHAVTGAEYRVIAFDGDDVELKRVNGPIDVVLPGQTLGIGGTFGLPEAATVDHVEVHLDAGDAVEVDLNRPFETERVVYWDDDGPGSGRVTALVHNPYERPVDDLVAYAVLYDEAGNIIGGGLEYVPFVPERAATGVTVYVSSAVEPARVELYAALTLASIAAYDAEQPPDTRPLRVVTWGWGYSVPVAKIGYGIVVENVNDKHAIQGSEYEIVVFDAEGNVLHTDSGSITLVFPGEQLGIGGWIIYVDAAIPARVDIHVRSGALMETDQQPIFTASDATYLASVGHGAVTGMIASSYPAELTDVIAYAICYDADGAIIGGGFAYLDPLPAGGSVFADVEVATIGVPYRVELYAAVTSLTILQ